MNRLKTFFISLTALAFLLLPVASVTAVNILGPACKQAPDSPVCKQAAQQGAVNPINHSIAVAVNIIAIVAGIAAVIMIIISGLKFITAGGAAPGQRSGDPNRIKSARASLTASIIGLIVVALAWTMVRFITDRVIK